MRNKVLVRITAEGRDKGKCFTLEEMPASQSEKWAMRTFLLLAKNGVEIPEEIAETGMAGIASLDLTQVLSTLDFRDVEPLLDEMFECIKINPNPNDPSIERALIESDIEEIKTRLQLRKEVLTLHTGFSLAADPSS